MFSDQERKAFDLGRRMAERGFTLQDNPFLHVHPRFSAQWSRGFLAVQTLQHFASTMPPQELTKRKKVVAITS